MDPEEILTIARQEGDLPNHWTVIPLNRPVVRQSAILWTLGSLLGFGLTALVYLAIRDIFTPISLQMVILLILAFIGVGSAYIASQKYRKLFDADRQLIVLTPELFVEQQGAKIIAVPFSQVSNITLRGAFGADVTSGQIDEQDPRNAVMGMGQMLGGRQPRRPRRTPDSLAFIDQRSDTPVVVAEDNSFAELPILEELLRRYVQSVPRVRSY